MLERELRREGFEVIGAGRHRQALELAERHAPDLVIAGETDLCRRLREGEPGRRWNQNVPVIVLSQPGADTATRVRALQHGADDVVERDLTVELLARVRALLRRAGAPHDDVLVAGGLVVDHRARQVRVLGTRVDLPAREFALAAKLATEPRRVFTKAELLRDVWGYRSPARTRTVDTHASRLRLRLRRAGCMDEIVVNVWGVGYRLLS